MAAEVPPPVVVRASEGSAAVSARPTVARSAAGAADEGSSFAGRSDVAESAGDASSGVAGTGKGGPAGDPSHGDADGGAVGPSGGGVAAAGLPGPGSGRVRVAGSSRSRADSAVVARAGAPVSGHGAAVRVPVATGAASSAAVARVVDADVRPVVALRAVPPPAASSPEPATTGVDPAGPGGTTAERLAGLTGGVLGRAADGSASVTFDGPVIARETVPSAPAPASPAPTGTPEQAPIDLDEVYEHVAARLRSELLADRERAGDLLGDLPALRPPR
jgi:hypothetical protein